MDHIYEKAMTNGAIGGKILGAGGGGFFLFYVPYDKKIHFLKKMNFLTHVPFNFEDGGSKIIYKDDDAKF